VEGDTGITFPPSQSTGAYFKHVKYKPENYRELLPLTKTFGFSAPATVIPVQKVHVSTSYS
jgi:hypothetical protein